MVLSNTDLADVVHAAEPARVDSSCFTALPFELVVLVITVAARDCVLASTPWVASLTLVCRAIHNAVDPILVETLRLTDTNLNAVAGNLTRFQRTQRINIVLRISRRDSETLLEALLWQHCSSLKAVTLLDNRLIFSDHVLFMLRSSHKGTSDSVTYLQIRFFTVFSHPLRQQSLPASVTHLVLDPFIRAPPSTDMQGFVSFLSRYLEEDSHSIQRLLLRTAFVSVDAKAAFIDAVTSIALAQRDMRMWLDEDRSLARGEEYMLKEEATSDEHLGLALWYRGRQLYVPT
ncbi:hypothetical protein EXIGLDRAFT_844766 [Exidia glandulosa HHB12029]|uniref:F-box domain-containing protein n=1 Tax=Exidia glandulosa HHB12029 TaxID=1314781 RepID=A0A165BTZ8_EXIGL|nr:hypothetical protein EXIGLDRAFT_844766 [Exidia glandulosa HHB12029]